MNLQQRFVRLATDVVVRRPALWAGFRGPLRRIFDAVAVRWTETRRPDYLAAYEAALDTLGTAPRRVLDVGTGPGLGARLGARRFPEADGVGVDISTRMLAEARRGLPGALAERVRFEEGDAARLPYADGSFDLVTMNNMIPFFDELARVVAPGGALAIAFSSGAQTPIYVPFERLRRELSRRGFPDVRELVTARGTAVVARKGR